MRFEEYLAEGSVRKVSPDKNLAKSLLKISAKRIKNIDVEKITDDNSFQIIENCYEAMREITDALMSVKGYKTYSHEASVEFLKAFFYPQLDTSTINKIDRYRILRNDIKYRGLLTTKIDAEVCLRDTKEIMPKLLELAKKEKVFD